MADKHSALHFNDGDQPPPPPLLVQDGSFDGLGSTYNTDGFAINASGLRLTEEGKLGALAEEVVEEQVHRDNLSICEELGRGAFAVVKRAQDLRNGTSYAIKCFNLYEESKRNMLKEEMSILVEMDCRTIVRWFGAFLDEDQRVNMILEFMDGGSVEDLVKHCRREGVAMPEKILAAMTFQILWGLNFLNFVGFMHRDIKPGNLLLNKVGEMKITDFGIGRKMKRGEHTGAAPPEEGDPEAAAQSQHLEQDEDLEEYFASTFVGTWVYMSPERLQGERYGANADVWSLGIILAEAILGAHPLQECSENFADMVVTLQQTPNGTLGSVIPDDVPYSEQMLGFVSWCLAVDPRLRGGPDELIDDPWFTQQLGGQGSDEAVLDEAVRVVGEWLRTELPSYMQPKTSATAASADADLGASGGDPGFDKNFETLASDDEDEGGQTFDGNFETLASDDED
uniref:mitogen-activated protein kinase kinase n=2 Tax=Rhizochromulina marina TaxID=1034831 RepID=A0A7S2RUA2_9STRA|mmetsp:Transcript_21134/g.61690  ORF Transcript_21134/g.61690 Transcript_21134/m.61690 type:complete len:454 (+) Transcript_21134:129-1490(+)